MDNAPLAREGKGVHLMAKYHPEKLGFWKRKDDLGGVVRAGKILSFDLLSNIMVKGAKGAPCKVRLFFRYGAWPKVGDYIVIPENSYARWMTATEFKANYTRVRVRTKTARKISRGAAS
jgi:hypothetical protein